MPESCLLTPDAENRAPDSQPRARAACLPARVTCNLQPITRNLSPVTFLLFLTLATVGCSYGISVRRSHHADVSYAWRDSVVETDDLSPRTRMLLHRWALEDSYDRHPKEAFARLRELAAKDPQKDMLFALAEMSYLLGRQAEKKEGAEPCVFYYLCAGYAYHYLFDAPPASAAIGLDDNPFDPRFRVACDLYNVGLAQCIRAAQHAGRLDPGQQLIVPTPDGKGFKLSVAHHGFPWQPEQFGPLLFCSDFDVVGLPNHYRGYGLGVALIGTRLTDSGEEGRSEGAKEGMKEGKNKERGAMGEEPRAPNEGRKPPREIISVSDLRDSLPAPRSQLPAPRFVLTPPRSPSCLRYPKEVSFPITAFFRFEGSVADLGTQRAGRLELYNPLQFQTVDIQGRPTPLEVDLTTPLAYFLSHTDLDGVEYAALWRADKLQDRAGLYTFEPYQPGKIPVVMVHGLLSSPLTWTTMFNDLRADPVIRQHYQFWFYFYPTGDPYLATAANLRRDLNNLRQELDPQHHDSALDRMVMVGHSMGGLVSKLLTEDSQDDFWGLVSNRPFQTLKANPETTSELQRVFFFDHQPFVRRVVFLGTPHHGSKLSPSLPVRMAAHFIRLSRGLRLAAGDIALEDPDLYPSLHDNQLVNSIDLLAPGAPALELLAARPKPPGVHFHSIIGEALGKGKDSTDGIVPYVSSHLDGVDSELVIRANHLSLHQKPEAILEVRRILLEHWEESSSEVAR